MATNYPRHRRSIFSGLLLIIIGGLLLLHNFGSRLPIWQILSRWWPLLIILWGLAKLYDHFMAQRTGEPAPPTVSAGEILLVLLLFAVVGGAGIIEWGSNHPNRGEIFFPWEDSYSFTENVPTQSVPKNAQVTIRTTRGNITVVGDDAPQITVTARKTATADSENDAKSHADQVHVTISSSTGGYLIEPEGQSTAGGGVAVEMEVHIPKGATLITETDRGNIQVTGVGGNVTAESRKGDMEVRQSGGDVSVDSHSGDTRVVGAAGNVRVSGRGTQVEVADVQGAVTVDGEFFGSLNFARLPKGVHFVSSRSDLAITELTGRIEIAGPGDLGIFDSTGNLTLTTTKRDLTLDNVMGRIQVGNKSGNITLRFSQPPKEQLDLTTQSGDVDITLPAKSNLDVSAHADRGDIDCDFDDLASKIDKRNGNSSLEASSGAHGPRVTLRTTYGTIRIRKGE